MQAPTDRLVAEALAKSGLVWISSSAGSSPVWHVVVDGIVYVVSGPGEQFCPQHEGRARVTTRAKETRERLATFDADVSRVNPQDDDWARATEALRAARLNAPNDDVVARWRESGVVLRLRPDLATVVVRGEHLPAPPTAQDENPGGSEPGTSGPPLDRPELAAQDGPQAERAAEQAGEQAGEWVGGGTAQNNDQAAPTAPAVSPRLDSGDDGDAAKVGP